MPKPAIDDSVCGAQTPTGACVLYASHNAPLLDGSALPHHSLATLRDANGLRDALKRVTAFLNVFPMRGGHSDNILTVWPSSEPGSLVLRKSDILAIMNAYSEACVSPEVPK